MSLERSIVTRMYGPRVGTRSEQSLRALVRQLRRNGWATLRLDSELRNQYASMVTYADWFFDQPADIKASVDIRSSEGHRGWVSPDEQGDYVDETERRYEAFDMGRPPRSDDIVDHPLRGLNRWPVGSVGAALGQQATELFTALSGLALQVGDAICDDLLVPHQMLRRLRREPVSQLRLIRYFDDDVIRLTPQRSEAAMGAHTDYEFFTLLFQTSPGTQVLNDRGEWLNVPYHDTITVLVGDMLEVFSNGSYRSTMHRAAANVAAGRISIPFFVGADFDATVKPMVAGPRTDGVNFGEHLMHQLARDFPYLRSSQSRHAQSGHALRSAFEERALLRSELGQAQNV